MLKWFKRGKAKQEAEQEPRAAEEIIQAEESELAEAAEAPADSGFEDLEEMKADEPDEAGEPDQDFIFEFDSGPETDSQGEPDFEPEPEPAPEPEKPAKKKKNGLLAKLRDRLAETRAVLNTRVDHLLLGVREIDDDILENLEEILITSDMGVKTSQTLMNTISRKVARRELDSPEKLKQTLRDELLRIMDLPPAEFDPAVKPHVVMVVGVNGVGKTTTIAKLAHRYVSEGKKVMMVAGDTFRAAAVEQLSIWAERVGADIVKQQTGADPSAVVFDALKAATARKVDVVIIDTAGRLHTSVNLMEELKKVRRITEREMPGAPHETLLVLDANTGQNAVNQAKLFNEAVQVTHMAMTKLDGTAKGGVLAAICHELGLPIRYIGIGEGMDDLRDFEARSFVEALFG